VRHECLSQHCWQDLDELRNCLVDPKRIAKRSRYVDVIDDLPSQFCVSPNVKNDTTITSKKQAAFGVVWDSLIALTAIIAGKKNSEIMHSKIPKVPVVARNSKNRLCPSPKCAVISVSPDCIMAARSRE